MKARNRGAATAIIARKENHTPFQVCMADTDTRSSEDKDKTADPENYDMPNEQERATMVLGELGTIPMKVFRSQCKKTPRTTTNQRATENKKTTTQDRTSKQKRFSYQRRHS